MPFRVLLLLAALPLLALHAQNDSPVFIVTNTPIPSPAAPGAFAPRLVNAPDGTVYLSWLEPAPGRHTAFRFSRFDSVNHTWSPVRTIGETLETSVPRDQTPRLAIAASGRLAALWLPAPGLLTASTSADSGANWSSPVPLNRPGQSAADPALQALPDDRFLAAWIEPAAPRHTLLARTLAPASPALVVAASVSPGSAPSLAAFPDGSALIAFRGLSPDGVSDLLTARFHDGRWDPPATSNIDNWQPASPPRDGPALASRDIHLAVAWFAAPGHDPRVNLATSDNAGDQWLGANRVDDIAPLGRPALVLFDDGSQLVAWIETPKTGPVALLRRISPRGNLSVPVQLGRVAADARPSLARVKDGDATPAQVLVAGLAPADSHLPLHASPFALALVTLPSAAQLAEADPCGCDPRPEDLRGYPLQGRVISIDAPRGTLQLDHDAILGVMPAGVTAVRTSPEVLRVVRPGALLLARIERDGPDWTLFAVRVLAALPPASP